MAAKRRRRTRRPRLFPELPAGAPVPHGEGFMSPSGRVTKCRQLVEFQRFGARIGVTMEDPFIAFECPPGAFPISLMVHKGQYVPIFVNPEL